MQDKIDSKGRYLEIPVKDRFWDKVCIINDENSCWEWKGSKVKNGYGSIVNSLSGIRNGEQKTFLAHRVSYELFYNQSPVGMVVCHKCDNRSCVRPHHLFLGTAKDNVHDMISKNRQATFEQLSNKGESNGAAKLNESQVLEIRKKYIPRVYTVKMLADEFSVSVPLIEKILARKVWKHV